ncbi:four helix bundle protein [bacterium]|nr:MAG: four helix bundle protein [bacterium]
MESQLDVWKISLFLVVDIYGLTEKFPKSEKYGITNQLRRASVSVTSNIAEGAARKSAVERRRYYEISRSSLVEIDTQLEISLQLKFCSETEKELAVIQEKMNHLFAKMSNLIQNTK